MQRRRLRQLVAPRRPQLLVCSAFLVFALAGGSAGAGPITATLEGCVTLDDPRLATAMWFAPGTFQAVAFDDDEAGCDTTIAHPVREAYVFDEDRLANTLGAWLNLSNLPTCGRRQYDAHYYLDNGILDPFGLKSLVIDTGIDCYPGPPPEPPSPPESVPEPGGLMLVAMGAAAAFGRYRHVSGRLS